MDYSYGEAPVLTRSLLASLFSGIIAVCAIEIFNIAYRGITGYSLSFVINVTTIIFGALLPSVAAGLIFYLLVPHIKGGIYIFRILFVALTVWICSIALHSHYGGNLPVFDGFRGLMIGCLVMLSIIILVLIPYFFKHHKAFID